MGLVFAWSPSSLMYSSIFLGSFEAWGKDVAKEYTASLTMPLQALDASLASCIVRQTRSALKLYAHFSSNTDSMA